MIGCFRSLDYHQLAGGGKKAGRQRVEIHAFPAAAAVAVQSVPGNGPVLGADGFGKNFLPQVVDDHDRRIVAPTSSDRIRKANCLCMFTPVSGWRDILKQPVLCQDNILF